MLRDVKPGCRAAIILIAFMPSLQVTLLGGGSQFLQAVVPVLNLSLCLAILLLIPPPPIFWKSSGVVLALLLAALLWAILPELMMKTGWWPDARLQRLMPDMLLSNACRFIGGMAALLAGALIGYRRGLLREAIPWLLIFGLCNLLLALGMRASDPAHVWTFGKTIHESRFTGTMLNANAAGALFGLWTVLAAGQAITFYARRTLTPARSVRIWLFGSTVLTVIFAMACVITVSRSATLLMLLALSILFLSTHLPARPAARWKWMAIPAVTLLFVAAIGDRLGLMVMGRFETLQADSVDRLKIWERYWQISQESPLFGFGLGSFSAVNTRHLATVDDAYFLSYINAAHNHVLQLLLAGGWPFLLLQLAAGMVIIAQAIAGRREKDAVSRSIWLGLAIILFCSMVDIALTMPALVTLSGILLGMLWGRGLRYGRRNQQAYLKRAF